jgi:putative ABC transport system permease protein
MFGYYFGLALRSLRHNPALSALMIMTLGFGVASTMTAYSVFRAVDSDPIPWKSDKLFVPQIASWGPQHDNSNNGEPNELLTYQDERALMRQRDGDTQVAMYQIRQTIVPTDPQKHSVSVGGHAVSAAFFSMFDVPFRYGRGWSSRDEEGRANVVVVTDSLAEKLFGTADSVGKTLNIGGHSYSVVGVTRDWRPQPRFYDVVNGPFGKFDDVLIPFNTAIERNFMVDGEMPCREPPGPEMQGVLTSNCAWISFFVQLNDATSVSAYRSYLDHYASEQQSMGRFSWPPNNRLRDLPAWLTARSVAPRDTKVSMAAAFGLLVVCVANTVGLMLAKFLRRSPEIGVRRALGARRSAVATQFAVEAAIVGLVGGLVGVILTILGQLAMRGLLSKGMGDLLHVDARLFIVTLLLSVLSAVIAGIYPTWRASHLRPALQLKTA